MPTDLQPSEHAPAGRKHGTAWALAVPVALSAVVDLWLPFAYRDHRRIEFFPVALGLLCGQNCLAAFWAVFGPRSWRWRWPIAMAAISLAGGLVILGARLARLPPGTTGDFLRGAPLLPLSMVAVQIPMLFFRISRGWEMVAPGQALVPTLRRGQIGLGPLLVSMAVVAFVLGLARKTVDSHAATWFQAAQFCALASVWNLLMLPCAWVALRWGRRATPAAIGYIVLLCLILTAASLVLGPQWSNREDFAFFLLFHASLAIVLYGSLRSARWAGWRLVTAREADDTRN